MLNNSNGRFHQLKDTINTFSMMTRSHVLILFTFYYDMWARLCTDEDNQLWIRSFYARYDSDTKSFWKRLGVRFRTFECHILPAIEYKSDVIISSVYFILVALYNLYYIPWVSQTELAEILQPLQLIGATIIEKDFCFIHLNKWWIQWINDGWKA